MITAEFQAFYSAIEQRVPIKSTKSKEFRKLLGRQVTTIATSAREKNVLAQKAIDVAGIDFVQSASSLAMYGETLIRNNVSQGTGNYQRSVAIYFYLLKRFDGKTGHDADVVKPIDDLVFGKGCTYLSVHGTGLSPLVAFDQLSPALSWTQLVNAHAVTGDVEVELETLTPGISGLDAVGFKLREPAPVTEIALDQGFRFRLRHLRGELGVALQGRGMRYSPLPYSLKNLVFPIAEPQLIFPEQSDEIDYFAEPDDIGHRQFVFLCVHRLLMKPLSEVVSHWPLDTEISHDSLNHLAAVLMNSSEHFQLKRIAVTFKAPKSTTP